MYGTALRGSRWGLLFPRSPRASRHCSSAHESGPKRLAALHQQRRQSCGCRLKMTAVASVAAVAAAAVQAQSLTDLDLLPIINGQGRILPTVPPGTAASVFAIFGENKQLQYVGFSKDLRNSLRTVFGRRPDKAHFYKAAHFELVDQAAMIDLRAAWFEEVGGQPNGNRLSNERNMWQQPVSAGAISERGKQQAAENEVETLRTMFRTRGCKEELVPDPKLLAEGKVDFLAAKEMSEADLQEQRDAVANMTRATSRVLANIDGEEVPFEIFFRNSYRTNGGHMFDVLVTHEDRETSHRLIIGREYYEEYNITPEEAVGRVFAFLLQKKVARQTEGMLHTALFPINYFSVSEVEQFFDDFLQTYDGTGIQLADSGKFWRFNRIYDYGHTADGAALSLPAQ